MADQDILHTADIMRAAMPFIDIGNKGFIEFFMKIFDLLASLKTLKTPANQSARGYEAGKFDLEGMLKAIRPVCNKNESDIIDKILNIFNMKRAFEMYSTMMNAMNAMQGFEGFTSDSSGSDAGTATGNFSGSMFESFLHAAADSASADGATSDGASADGATSDGTSADGTSAEEPHLNGESRSSTPSEENPADSGTTKNQDTSSGSGMKMNDKMLDMLKAMVPPEQRTTFENLSMLLNSMSYDNTSKPEESKEQSNG